MKYKLIIIFIFFIINTILICSIYKSNSYQLSYKINDYSITENYKSHSYYIKIKKEKDTFNYSYDSNYIGKKLIKNIKSFNENNNKCIYFKNDNLKTFPICKNNNEMVDYFKLEGDNNFYSIPEYNELNFNNKNINIITNINKKIYIWNHKGYDVYYNKTFKSIDIFKKDFYYNNTSYFLNKYIITYDYENNNGFIIIDTTNNQKFDIQFPYDVSDKLYIVGDYNNEIYFIDTKNYIEYKLNINKKNIIKISEEDTFIIENNKFLKVAAKDIYDEKYKFSADNNHYRYSLENNKIYLYTPFGSMQTVVSKADRILFKNGIEIFYSIKNTMYVYSLKFGIIKILTYPELNYNINNQIYIY